MTAFRRDLLTLFHAALAAVNGRRCVAEYLSNHLPRDAVYVIAAGKASAAMTAGAFDAAGPLIRGALVIGCRDYADPCLLVRLPVTLVEGGHPLPDANSLQAGQALLRFVAALPAGAPVLFLVSGGASSLVEVPVEGVGPNDLLRLNRWLLGSGLAIGQINQVRKAVSAIKGGRLAGRLGERPVLALYVSDVPGDDPAVIGSGLLLPDHGGIPSELALPAWVRRLVDTGLAGLHPPAVTGHIRHHIVAGLAQARAAVAYAAKERGYPVTVHPAFVDGDAAEAGKHLAAALMRGERGIHVWGGETTVRLPAKPGCGGRNQHLALAAATTMQGCDGVALLAAGSDGRDGNSDAAGAVVDGGSVARGERQGLVAAACLAAADAGAFLTASGDVLVTGPTDTNVMDLIIGVCA